METHDAAILRIDRGKNTKVYKVGELIQPHHMMHKEYSPVSPWLGIVF